VGVDAIDLALTFERAVLGRGHYSDPVPLHRLMLLQETTGFTATRPPCIQTISSEVWPQVQVVLSEPFLMVWHTFACSEVHSVNKLSSGRIPFTVLESYRSINFDQGLVTDCEKQSSAS